jgi:polar amino acid transport system substrate-binding protein
MIGCAKSGSGTTASGVSLITKGKLTVCVNTPYPPFQTKDANNQIVGFDIDMMNLVAKKLGVSTSVVDTPFEGIKSGLDLKTGKCDLAAAGLTADDERRKAMDFSDSYFDNTQALVIRAADTKSFRTVGDLNGKKVAVQSGTTGAKYARKIEAEEGIQIVEYPDFGLQQQALATKQVDASIADLPVWTEFSRKNPSQIEIIEQFDTGEKYAYAARKGANPKLLATVNNTLRTSKADGSYSEIFEKWLGSTKP